jgi:hypothetical protein
VLPRRAEESCAFRRERANRAAAGLTNQAMFFVFSQNASFATPASVMPRRFGRCRSTSERAIADGAPTEVELYELPACVRDAERYSVEQEVEFGSSHP